MPSRTCWFTFILLSISFIISFQNSSAATTARVDYDRNRLSVHADGIALGELLSMVEKQTGVRFSYDDLLAETIVYANFENNVLADGIKRILSQLNHAIVYDGSGGIRTVFIVGRQMASSESQRNQGKLYASQPENDISVTLSEQEEAVPFSVQTPGQEPDVHLLPPGAEAPIPLQVPPGAELPIPAQLPPGAGTTLPDQIAQGPSGETATISLQGPPGAELRLPPPGAENQMLPPPMNQSDDSSTPSNTEEQAPPRSD